MICVEEYSKSDAETTFIGSPAETAVDYDQAVDFLWYCLMFV